MTTTKDTAYLTFNEETEHSNEEDCKENKDSSATNQYISKILKIIFDDKSSEKTNQNFNINLSDTETNPDQRHLVQDEDRIKPSLLCCDTSNRINEKRKISVISAAVIILILTVIAIIILTSHSFETNNTKLSCKTIAGPETNKSCIFPFKYKGIIHHNCTLAGDSSAGAWCSTLVDGEGNHIGGRHWGTCGQSCFISTVNQKAHKQISSCKTNDGPDRNKECIFPFQFRNNTYKTCTWDGDSMVGAWCSTKSGDSGQRLDGLNWGNCGNGCPIPTKPKDMGPNVCSGPGYTKAIRDDGSSICYYFYKDNPVRYSYNFDDAKLFCEKKGMEMVDIKGPKDDENVYSVIESGFEKYVLLGARKVPPPQIANCTNCVPDYGQFFWPDGSLVSYFDWIEGEPNLPKIQHCIQMYYNEGGKWRDATCHERRTAIMCQLPQNGISNNSKFDITVTQKMGWCLDLKGKELKKGDQISLANAKSAEECLALCKKEKDAKGCEYNKDGKCSYHARLVASANGHQDYICWIFTEGNPKCDIKTTKTYDRECCSVENPCGLGQGDCDKDEECSGDLVCGRDNCGLEYNSATADCCQFRGSPKKFGKWYDVGECTFPSDLGLSKNVTKQNKSCASGRLQFQIRTCQDGTGGGDSDDNEDRRNKGDHVCKTEEKTRFIPCEIDECIDSSKRYASNGKGCPQNFVLHDNQCYGFFVNKTQKLKYSEAKDRCQHTLGYNLASVFSREETNFLGNMTVQTNNEIGKSSFNFPWIGLHKNAYSPEGAWIWADGSQVSYTNWNANEPNGHKETEHCVHLYPGGEWNDAACDEPRGYICKGPLLSDDEMKIEAKGCRTIKGPSPNLPCVFPFEFKGIDHNQCIWDGDSENGAWCSTKVDKKGKHVSGGGHWGNCAPECPFSAPLKEHIEETTVISVDEKSTTEEEKDDSESTKGTCDPYSQQACIDAGKLLGLTIGGKGYKFAAAYDTKGCYAYHTGIFAGRVYYGTGGKRKEMQSQAYYPKFRPHGYDCSEKGCTVLGIRGDGTARGTCDQYLLCHFDGSCKPFCNVLGSPGNGRERGTCNEGLVCLSDGSCRDPATCGFKKIKSNEVVYHEGNVVGNHSGISQKDCKHFCHQNSECMSFSYCDNSKYCRLNDKILTGSEKTKRNGEQCTTYFHSCEPTWSGPTSKIWSDDQCDDLDNYGHLPQYNVDSCKKACVQNKRCTAINFIIGGGCVLRACSIPVPDPTWSYENHEGYFIIKDDEDEITKDSATKLSVVEGSTPAKGVKSVKGYCSFGVNIIANNQGNQIESRYDTTVDGCKEACRQTSGCKSFAYCSWESSCHLKDKILNKSYTDVSRQGGCSTYYECDEDGKVTSTEPTSDEIMDNKSVNGTETLSSEVCPERCKTCKTGGANDGGIAVNTKGICENFCSIHGYCGKGRNYKSGDDCSYCKLEEYTYVGNGWCRPDGCEVTDQACRISGYFKDESNSNECKLKCSNEPSCTGYAISKEPHSYANRCYVYGHLSFTDSFSEWNSFPQHHFIPSNTATNGDNNVGCFLRNEIPDTIQATVETEYICGNRHCLWANYEEDEDWGYYSRTNNDCTFCQDKCNNDTNCAGVECGGRVNYCSWWKQGRCVTKDEQTEEHDEHQTCIKFGAGYQVASEAYGCSYKGCDWSTGEQGVDWDYYSRSNGNCTYCMNECDKDKTCEGVECGGSHCSWWKNGKCDDAHEHTLPSNGKDKMCVKKPNFRACSENSKLSLLGDHSVMSTNGWEFDLTHDGSIQTDTYKSIDEKCGTISKWYGWSSHAFVGTISTVLNGTGEVTLDFGNCWDDGNVKVYLNSKLMAVAGEEVHSITKTFSFSPGSLLEIKDEDGNAVILLNSIKFSCNVKGKENKDATIGTGSSEGSGEADYYVYDYDAVHFTTPGPKECIDIALGDISSDSTMIKNGWNVDIEYSNTKDWSQDYLVNCGTQTFYGYHGDQKVGTVSATFQGSGNATLIFGNCYKEGFVEVLLNEEQLKQANQEKYKTVAFSYKRGDILKIREVNTAIMKLYYFGITGCEDHENICKTTSGPSSDVPCVFPFKFRGEIHNECNWDGDASDGAWCSTLIDDSGQHVGGKGNWGNCGPKCPIPPSPKDIASDREISKKDLWKRESESKYCKNHVKPTIDVSNQKECQDQCVSYSNECIGIAYSYKFGNTHHCYLCLDDNLSYASNDFGFYRRNGTETKTPSEKLKEFKCVGEGYSSAVRDDGSKICYYYFDFGHFNHSHHDTTKFCHDKDMTMVDIKGPKDDANVYKVVQKGGQRYVLLGARKENTTNSVTTTTACYTCPLPENDYGGFYWQDGSKVTYFNWVEGEPGDPENQHCIQMFHDEGGKWRDATCHEKRNAIICQKPI